jgi:hypothetical protein
MKCVDSAQEGRAMDMQQLTRDDIINAFGRVDDGVVAQIIASGATLRDLTEARAWLEQQRAADE